MAKPGWLGSILQQMREQPDAPAVVTDRWVVRYGKLARWVDAASRSLTRFGVARGQRCALTLEQTPQHLALILAVARVGAVSLPLPAHWPADIRSKFAQSLSVARLVGQRPEDELPGIPFRLADPNFFSQDSGEKFSTDEPGDYVAARIFVSASGLGSPRALECSHACMAHRMEQAARHGGLADTARVLCENLNYTFLVPALATLCKGGTVVLPRPGPGGLLVALVNGAVSHARLSAVATAGMLRQLGADHVDLPGLQRLEVVGPALSGEQAAALRHQLTANLWALYAPMESGIVTMVAADEKLQLPSTVGKAVRDVEVQIVDGNGRPLLPGERGELRVRTPFMPAGYLYPGAASRQRFHDGWFYPGNIARLMEDGLLNLEPT